MSLANFDITSFPDSIAAGDPPEGQETDFFAPNPLATSLIVEQAVFLPLAIAAVCMRIYVRGWVTRSLGWDDWFMIVALICSVAHTVMVLYGLHLGFGQHLWNIRISSLTPPRLQSITSIAFIYPLAVLCVKTSISLLYLRTFGRARNSRIRPTLYVFLVVNILVYGAYFVTEVVVNPLCSRVLVALGKSFCLSDQAPVTIASGAWNTATDLFLTILPVPLILKLQLERRKKIGVFLVLGAGFVASLISLARLIYVSKFQVNEDQFYAAGRVSQLSSVELNLGIICSSLVVMPRFLRTPLMQWGSYLSIWHSIKSRLNLTRSRAGDEQVILDSEAEKRLRAEGSLSRSLNSEEAAAAFARGESGTSGQQSGTSGRTDKSKKSGRSDRSNDDGKPRLPPLRPLSHTPIRLPFFGKSIGASGAMSGAMSSAEPDDEFDRR